MRTLQDVFNTFGYKVAIHVEVESQTTQLAFILDILGIKWSSGDIFSSGLSYWHTYGPKTVYSFENDKEPKLGYASVIFHKEEGYPIIKFEDFILWWNGEKEYTPQDSKSESPSPELIEMAKNAILEGILDWSPDHPAFEDATLQAIARVFYNAIARSRKQQIKQQFEQQRKDRK